MKKALAAAQEAADAGDAALALAHLLTAWREARQPRVAALVEAFGALAARDVSPVTGADADAREEAWRARAKSPAPEGLGALLASLTDGVKVAAVAARIERLGELDPDPRVAARYVEMLRAPPFTASSHKPVWSEVFRQLAEVHGDARTAAAVAALAPEYTHVFGETVMGRWMHSQLSKLADAMEGAFAKGPALSLDVEALVAAIEARVAPPACEPAVTAADDEAAHLRAIADDPDDPARREVHRAWLAARGAPRAEFIALQARRHASCGALPPDDEAREQALLKKHLAAWLGPIAPVVKSPRFERGYLVECALVPKGAKTGPAVGDPRWATVETLHCTWQKNYGREVILHPAMRSLRRLEAAPVELAETLLNDPTPRVIESIACMYGIHPRALPATVRAPGLPRLHEFAISCWYKDEAVSKYSTTWQPPGVFAPFLQSPLAARLNLLRWAVHDTFVDAAAAALDAHAPPGFTARVDLYYLSLLRGPDGRWSHVEVDLKSPDEELKYGNSRVRTLRRLDPARPLRVTVRAPASADLSMLAKEFAAVREHFTRAEVVLPA